jgi:hypothetical protein
MNTCSASNKTRLVLLSAALTLGSVAWLPFTANAADQVKGAQRLMQIASPAEAENLKPGDQIVMACTKCKSAMIHRVDTEKGHVKVMTIGEKHMCPGCDSTITVVGQGKSKQDKVTHTCEKCGDDSVFCCATKAGSGPTPGMKKK